MATRREVIQPKRGDKRYARRDQEGQFTNDQTSVGKSLAAAAGRMLRQSSRKVRATEVIKKKFKKAPIA